MLCAGNQEWETAREAHGSVCLRRAGKQNREPSWQAFGNAKHLPLILLEQAGVGRHISEAGAYGWWQAVSLLAEQ